MTGYGAADGKVGRGRLYVEIKSVNHRFSEFNIKIPPRMGILESYIRRYLQPKFERGKVDIFVKEKTSLFGGVSVSIDTELAHKYHRLITKLRKDLGLPKDGDFLHVVGLDRIIHTEEQEGSYEKLWGPIKALFDRAASHVISMQMKEGEHTLKDQERRLFKVQSLVKKIGDQSARVLGQHYNRVRRKVAGAQESKNVDEQRLVQEVAFLGGRQDIAEELTRLASHAKQYDDLLHSKEPVGRKLDFLLQEMNREINTIGAKAADAKISQLVVDCKAELERLKEQIQNVE